jgi:hypothetical protein
LAVITLYFCTITEEGVINKNLQVLVDELFKSEGMEILIKPGKIINGYYK